MRKLSSILLFATFFVLLCSMPAWAQFDDENTGNEDMTDYFTDADPMNIKNGIMSALGYTNIGDKSYIGMRIKPEFAIGKFGIGMDIPLLFSLDDGSFRTDEFKSGVGILRLVRYARWGVKKRDPVFLRVGDIGGTYLGYGLLVNNYTNSISFEKRKVGLSYDVLIKDVVGIEGFYSDFDPQSFNLFAIRPYVRPLAKSGIPILKTLDIGGSFVTDHDHTKIEIDDMVVQNQFIQDGVNAFGADMGIHFINRRFLRVSGYVQYAHLQKNDSPLLQDSLEHLSNPVYNPDITANDSAHIAGYGAGSGFSIGVEARSVFMGNIFRLDARIDRLWYTDYFLPQFFDAAYEMNKDGRFLTLAQAEEKKGVYGSLSATLIDKIRVTGKLLIPDKMGESAPGLLQLDMQGIDLGPIFLQGTYVKGGLTHFGLDEVFTFDERSLANVRVAYKMKKWGIIEMLVGMDYRWTWARTNDNTFEATSHIMPYFGMNLPFGQNNSSNNDEPDYEVEY